MLGFQFGYRKMVECNYKLGDRGIFKFYPAPGGCSCRSVHGPSPFYPQIIG
jgi:hypothetical protein